jgi:hypothetical protein
VVADLCGWDGPLGRLLGRSGELPGEQYAPLLQHQVPVPAFAQHVMLHDKAAFGRSRRLTVIHLAALPD